MQSLIWLSDKMAISRQYMAQRVSPCVRQSMLLYVLGKTWLKYGMFFSSLIWGGAKLPAILFKVVLSFTTFVQWAWLLLAKLPTIYPPHPLPSRGTEQHPLQCCISNRFWVCGALGGRHSAKQSSNWTGRASDIKFGCTLGIRTQRCTNNSWMRNEFNGFVHRA